MDDEQRGRTLKALHQVKGLSARDGEAIADLGIPLWESLVLAYLRIARDLLARDSTFDVQARQEIWNAWKSQIMRALDEGLRYRKNDRLVTAVSIVAALYPALNLGARLTGYKMLDDVVRFAQWDGVSLKRERRARHIRLKDRILKCGLWVAASGLLIRDRDLSQTERDSLVDQGYCEIWGLEIDYPHVEAAIPLVKAVLPVVWQTEGSVTLIAPLLAQEPPT